VRLDHLLSKEEEVEIVLLFSYQRAEVEAKEILRECFRINLL